jgi:hypothetical protein
MPVLWVVVAVVLLAAVYWWWRWRSGAAGPGRCYYQIAVLVFAVGVATHTYLHWVTHPGFAANGYTHGHNFWFSMFYDLQTHPDWKRRYAPIYGDQTGDVLTEHACRLYLANHREEWPRWNPTGGDPFQAGFPQTGLEDLCRKAFFEFARRDPIYVAQVWLVYHPRVLLAYTGIFFRQYLSWLAPLPLVGLLGLGVICGLIAARPVVLDTITYAPVVAYLCVVAALPNVASVVIPETLTDYFTLLAIAIGMIITAAGAGMGLLISFAARSSSHGEMTQGAVAANAPSELVT